VCLNRSRVWCGQPVHEVDVDAREAERARVLDQPLRLLDGLLAVHRVLHLGVEVLDAHADAAEAEAGERLEVRARRDAGVHLEGLLGVGADREAGRDEAVQALELRGREVGRRAAAEVELHDLLRAAGERVGGEADLLLEAREVALDDRVVAADDDVAAAVRAERLAERQVRVEREGRRALPAGAVDVAGGGARDLVHEVRRGRVRGVARAGAVVLRRELEGAREVGAVRRTVHEGGAHAGVPFGR
jgi:hypothetical protein